MKTVKSLLHSLRGDRSGTMVIETAFVLPILVLMCLGGFEVSMLVARDTELQSTLAEAEAISIASPPATAAERDTVKAIIATSAGLDPAQGEVVLVQKYRCGTDANLVDSEASCATGTIISSYLQITLTDTYEPIWTNFGIGSPVQLNKTRTVQIS